MKASPLGFPGGSVVKNPPANAGDTGSTPGPVRSYLLQSHSVHSLQLKNSPTIQETQEMQDQSLGLEDPLKEEMATHSSILAWEFPWTGEPIGYSPWSHKESDTTERTHTHTHTHTAVA